MEAGGGADQVRMRLERDTAFGLGVFQVVNAGEMPVGERGVGQWPEMLDWLELRRVGRQKQQMDMVRDAQVDAGVPARPVEDQYNLFVWSRADLTRKCR
jgi:hypothetical protein